MLLLSDVTIPINLSKDYVRCAVIIHVFAIIVLFQSALPVSLDCLVIFFLIRQLWHIALCKTPFQIYQKIGYHEKHWYLYQINGEKKRYQQVKIRFDGVFFILIVLIAEQDKKKLILFNDQITNSHLRIIKLISKVGTSE